MVRRVSRVLRGVTKNCRHRRESRHSPSGHYSETLQAVYWGEYRAGEDFFLSGVQVLVRVKRKCLCHDLRRKRISMRYLKETSVLPPRRVLEKGGGQ